MRTVLRIFILLLLGFGIWWFFFRSKSHDRGPKQQPLAVKKHSQKFNQSINDAMTEYFDLQVAFVDADTFRVKEEARALLPRLDSIQVEELKKDTSGIYQTAVIQISDLKSNTSALLMESDITEMRKNFRMISENLYPFLKTVGYEGPKLYWQNCAMPFGEGSSANWLSKTYEIQNPYLGKFHPEFKSGMLHCGEVQDSIYAK